MQVTHDQKLLIAVGRSRKASQWQHRELMWSEFLDKLSTTTRTRETAAEYAVMSKNDKDAIKDVGGFVGGRFAGTARKADEVAARSLITLDIDHGNASTVGIVEDMMEGTAWCLYSTHSHTARTPRYRLVVTASEYKAAEEILKNVSQTAIDSLTADGGAAVLKRESK